MTTQSLTAYVSRTNSWKTTITKDGAAVNLSGALLFMSVKRAPLDAEGDAVASLSVGSGITVDNSATGEVSITFADTLSISAGKYFYDLKCVHPTHGKFSPNAGDITFSKLPTDRIA